MKSAYSDSDTIVAIATPSGAGALGIIRVSGPEAFGLCSAIISLKEGQKFMNLPPQKAALGLLHRNGTRIDQVVATAFRSPHSYTGEDLIEISCHGSPIVLKETLELLVELGARMAEPGEFSQRAFLNGKMDLSQAEAVADLIAAQTELSRSVAFDQLEGRLSTEIKKIKETLVEVLAHLEVGIDHSDDTTVGPQFGSQETQARIASCLEKVGELVQSYEHGRIVKEGLKIAIVGKPNVGKSSLLNCLLKMDRAIVTAIPGTTRDTIEEGFDLSGIPAILVDTAGIRDKALDPVEKVGMERTLDSIRISDLVLIVLDAGEELTDEDRKIAFLVKNKERRLVVLNKSDLPKKINFEKTETLFPGVPQVEISALNNAGIEILIDKLTGQFASLDEKSIRQHVLIGSLRHKNCLCVAQESLGKALSLCREGGPEECLALEIRGALDGLGELVGDVMTEEILDQIFSKFCIGK